MHSSVLDHQEIVSDACDNFVVVCFFSFFFHRGKYEVIFLIAILLKSQSKVLLKSRVCGSHGM